MITGALPFWNAVPHPAMARAATRRTNAAVVGMLGSALYDSVWTSTILHPRDFAVALVAFVLLMVWRVAPWAVVLLTAVIGDALAHL